MVDKGKYIDFAVDTLSEIEGISTEIGIIIELSEKIKELEARITQLELKK